MTLTASSPPPRRRRFLIKLSIAALSPIVFIGAAELALAAFGARVPRYVGLPRGEINYFIPYESPGAPAGFTRAFPRNYKIFPEKLPLFLKQKPENGLRVFALGESSVQGLPYEVGAFSDWLRVRMGAMLPQYSVEVVNAGNAGWYAAEIATLLKECLEHSPDLFVWMVGHNEMVPENVLRIRREVRSPAGAKIKHSAESLRLTHFLARWLPSLVKGQRDTLHDRKAADERPCYNPEELILMKARFREATAGAIADAKRAGVNIVMCTMPKNLRECPPSHSFFSEKLLMDTALKFRWEQSYKDGLDALGRQDWRDALARFDEARQLDHLPAKLHFGLAQAYEKLGNAEAARAEYLKALDLDGCPMRAHPWVEDAIRAVAAEYQVPLLDLERLFNAEGALGLAGDELICDNVHPNLRGQERIADELLRIFEREFHLRFDRSRDLGPARARKELGVDQLDGMVSAKSECIANLGLVLGSGNVDTLWKKTYELCQTVLKLNPTDWEVTAALGLLEAMNGNGPLGKELVEKAMTNDGYVYVSYVYYHKYEPPFQRVLDKAGVDIDRFEKAFTPGQRVQFENRVARARQR